MWLPTHSQDCSYSRKTDKTSMLQVACNNCLVLDKVSCYVFFFFFFSSRRRHTRCSRDWSSDVCSSDLERNEPHDAATRFAKVVDAGRHGRANGGNGSEMVRRWANHEAVAWPGAGPEYLLQGVSARAGDGHRYRRHRSAIFALHMPRTPVTILCLASYFKGHDFLRECKRQGARMLLVTRESLRNLEWPRESLDDLLVMPDLTRREHVINGVSWLARTESIDRIVALDEFDLEMASTLREHLRVPGMGESNVRFFRDKLAMRMQAEERGILVPAFVPILNYARIREFMERVPSPWLLKPRHSASAIGIRKITHADELWPLLDQLGDKQSFHLMERYVPGDVYH